MRAGQLIDRTSDTECRMTGREPNTAGVLLDCQSPDTAEGSLAEIFETPVGDITSALMILNVDDEDAFAVSYPFLRVVEDAGLSPRRSADTAWFHLSRVVGPEAFDGGVMPLKQSLDGIWRVLERCAQEFVSVNHWTEFRRCVETGYPCHHGGLYRTKVDDSAHWGPCAMLVRDAAFSAAAMAHHDYLKVPEIVEDICICFKDAFGKDLQKHYEQVTVPVIVKFWSADADENAIDAALGYVWSHLRSQPLSHVTNTCFDAEGKAIGVENILAVEVVRPS